MKNCLLIGLTALALIVFGACNGKEEVDKPECTRNADCGDGKICSADNTCVNDPGHANQPECVSHADCMDTAFPICDNGVCIADTAQPAQCADGQYLIHGHCYAEGDVCDDSDDVLFAGQCEGNDVVYCDNDIIVVEHCADAGMSCSDSNYGAACDWAVLPCDEIGETLYGCVSFEGHEYLFHYTCDTLTDGSLGASWDGESYEWCSGGCDSATNQCKQIEGAGEACDETFPGRCDGNIIVYCSEGVVTVTDCSVIDASCDILSGTNSAYCYTDEYLAGNACNEGAEGLACVENLGFHFSTAWMCEQLTISGAYVWEYHSEEMCNGSCDEETGQCALIVENEGQPCETEGENAFAANCGGDSGNIAISCVNGIVTASNCLLFGNEYSCQTSTDGNRAECVNEDLICQAGSEPVKSCESTTPVEYNCLEYNDGSYYWSPVYTPCAEGLSCVYSTGECAQIPEEWRCDYTDGSTAYFDGECDCGCGIIDADCADGNASSCESILCDEEGAAPNATQNWICE